MSEMVYIQDDFGNRIPLLDGYGNLSVQVIMLYTEDKLTEADRRAVNDLAATDEMAKDALEGFALTSSASKTRYHLGQLNNDIQKRTGAAAVSSMPRQESNFDYRKLAAAIAVLIVIGGATFFGIQYFAKDELADNTKSIPTEQQQPQNRDVVREAESMKDSATDALTSDDEAIKPEPSPLPDAIENAKQEAQKALKEKVEANMKKTAEVAEKTARAQVKKSNAEKLAAAKTVAAREVEEDLKPADTEAVVEEVAEADQLAESGSTDKNEETANAYDDRQQQKLKEDVNAANQRADRALSSLEQRTRTSEQKRGEEEEPAYEIAAEREATSDRPHAAKYPDGDIAMYKFIERKKIYTEAMKALNMNGAVTVSFAIEPDGRVANAKIVNGNNGLMNEDALRVVRSMPKWKAAKDAEGQPVRSTRTVVIKYGD